MSRKLIVISLMSLMALLTACASGTVTTAAAPEVVDEYTETRSDGVRTDESVADSGSDWFDVGFGLTCPDEVSEHSTFRYSEDARGADSVESAAGSWWTEDPGATSWNRATLTESIDHSAATYADDEGRVVLKLGFFDAGNGWLVGTKISCAN